MKYWLFLMANLIFSFNVMSQTLKKELSFLETYTGGEHRQKQKQWLKFLAEAKDYPDLCWNEKENEFICEYKIPFTITQDEAYNKAKDWVAETYRDYKAVVDYENFNSKKIVLKPMQRINATFYFRILGRKEYSVLLNTYKTIVITVLYESINIKFQDFVVSVEDARIPLQSYFPLMAQDNHDSMYSYYKIATDIMKDVDYNVLRFQEYFK